MAVMCPLPLRCHPGLECGVLVFIRDLLRLAAEREANKPLTVFLKGATGWLALIVGNVGNRKF